MRILFTTCKPFTSERTRIIQLNCLRSLKIEASKVLVFGDEDGVANVCQELGLVHIPDIKRKFGVPRVDKMFKKAQKLGSPNDVFGYVNADIIVHGVKKAIKYTSRKLNRYLIVGRRLDVKVKREISFEDKWYKPLLAKATVGPMCAIDYFIFTYGLWPIIPKFVVGHVAYDNWLLESAINRVENVVDGTTRIRAFHQKHKLRSANRPGDRYNIELFGGNPRAPRGFITRIKWRLSKRELQKCR